MIVSNDRFQFIHHRTNRLHGRFDVLGTTLRSLLGIGDTVSPAPRFVIQFFQDRNFLIQRLDQALQFAAAAASSP